MALITNGYCSFCRSEQSQINFVCAGCERRKIKEARVKAIAREALLRVRRESKNRVLSIK